MNLEVVKDYYGKVLKSSQDLKTSACCEGDGPPI
jgi:arsenite methyltransferase